MMRSIKYPLWTMAIAILVPGAGCDKQDDTKTKVAHPTRDEQEQTMKELEQQIGIVFPPGAVVINASDGGGREPSWGFYMWAIFSPSPLEMPPMKNPHDKKYASRFLDKDMIRYMEGSMAWKRKIMGAKMAFGCTWEIGGFNYAGTLVRTEEGDYLVIERSKKK